MSRVIPFPQKQQPSAVGPMMALITESTVIESSNGPLLQVQMLASLDEVDPDQRKVLKEILQSGNITLLTLEQGQ
ncbi:MAG: hypothetical protein RKO25_03810 [Candidatus Contendobacter sp.]|nr:hypothetical protein [Candidatus Contendobacter sp.]